MIVSIKWYDSHSPATDVWIDRDQINHKALKINTVGHLIKETETAITVASSVASKSSNQVAGIITIPKCAIIQKKNL